MRRAEFGALLNLREDLIPTDRSNRSNSPLTGLNYITIHNTSNPNRGADALAHSEFVKNIGRHSGGAVSWHYTVDDKRVIKHLPTNEIGWHAGSAKGNKESVGIEICMNEDIDQKAAFLRAARLAAVLQFDYRLSEERIVPHYFWSRKKCPILLLDDGLPGNKWRSFLKLVKEQLLQIEPN